MKKSGIENDPNLKEQLKVLAHHPVPAAHMAPHGTIRKAKAWHMKMVHDPRKKDA